MPGPSYFSLGSRGVEKVLVVLEYLILLKKRSAYACTVFMTLSLGSIKPPQE